MHLMTREAFDTYGRVLSHDGVLLFHISNKFLDLEPVVSAAAKAGGWSAAKLLYFPGPNVEQPRAVSFWVALSHDPATIEALKARDATWRPLNDYPAFTPWTDDYSTIVPLVKLFRKP